jgi:hypothetical protein
MASLSAEHCGSSAMDWQNWNRVLTDSNCCSDGGTNTKACRLSRAWASWTLLRKVHYPRIPLKVSQIDLSLHKIVCSCLRACTSPASMVHAQSVSLFFFHRPESTHILKLSLFSLSCSSIFFSNIPFPFKMENKGYLCRTQKIVILSAQKLNESMQFINVISSYYHYEHHVIIPSYLELCHNSKGFVNICDTICVCILVIWYEHPFCFLTTFACC